MIVAMKKDATDAEVRLVLERISSHGLNPLSLPGGDRTAIGIASSIPPELREPLTQMIQTLPGVDHVTQVSRPFKLASREFHPTDTIVRVGSVEIGGKAQVIMAGPCAIESREQMLSAARAVKEAGAAILRGGAFKPRSSPYAFQGMEESGLQLLREAGDETGLPIISEVVDPHDVPLVSRYVDILQIGARNMQNFPLLIAAGRSERPVMLKRGLSAAIDDWMLSAEYILAQGNGQVILCERGVHPIDRTYTRNTLDLSAVPVVKTISHLPIIVDPSHATGGWRLIPSMSKAAIACGADGLIIEVHPDPACALCDGPQSLKPERFAALMAELRAISEIVGRGM